MAKLNINPTRMALSNLKSRLVTAKRGHKLLKDKQDELMRRFIDMIRKNKSLRIEVEKALSNSFKSFLLASAVMSPEFLEQAVAFPKEKVSVSIETKNVMSVLIPQMKFERTQSKGAIFPYGFAQTSSELDDAILELHGVMNMLLELSEIEKSCQLMADEIEKTRRRVNALEYRTIPDLEETIKFIRMKLDENERATILSLIHI